MSQTYMHAATQHAMPIDPSRLRSDRNPAPQSLPNLFVVGAAAKSGTTALYHYFKLHPDAFVPTVKEVNYMAFFDGLPPLAGPGDRDIVARRSVTNLDDYQRCSQPEPRNRSPPTSAQAICNFPRQPTKLRSFVRAQKS